jgi:hypothetical protein
VRDLDAGDVVDPILGAIISIMYGPDSQKLHRVRFFADRSDRSIPWCLSPSKVGIRSYETICRENRGEINAENRVSVFFGSKLA